MKLINIVGGKFILVSNKRTIEDTTPAATNPSAITNNDSTVIRPGLEKPDSRVFNEGTLPEGNIKETIIRTDRRHIETVSIGYLSNTKSPIEINPMIIIVKETKLSSNITNP
jgi:hypothetical protein